MSREIIGVKKICNLGLASIKLMYRSSYFCSRKRIRVAENKTLDCKCSLFEKYHFTPSRFT